MIVGLLFFSLASTSYAGIVANVTFMVLDDTPLLDGRVGHVTGKPTDGLLLSFSSSCFSKFGQTTLIGKSVDFVQAGSPPTQAIILTADDIISSDRLHNIAFGGSCFNGPLIYDVYDADTD